MVHISRPLIRKITKSGRYSYVVGIPKRLFRELHWKEHQKVIIRRIGKRLVIRDWKKKKSLNPKS